MPSIKGTASISSTSALTKLLRKTRFPPHFSTPVDITKLHRGVLSHWIEQRIEQILGFEDEIVSSTATNLFLPEVNEDGKVAEVDPRKAQLDLVGFLGDKESAEFASELWEMMIDGSTRKSGIPLILVEKKKEEMKRAREEAVGRGGGRGGQQAGARVAMRRDPEMNAFVREAARRAEAARAVLANDRGNNSGGRGLVVPPSPGSTRQQSNDGYRGGRDNGHAESKGDFFDEFGRRRGDYSSQDNYKKPEPEMQHRKRSRSPSRSRSCSPSSRSSGSYSPSPSPRRRDRRGGVRHNDRERRRDGGGGRRSDSRSRSRSRSASSEDSSRRRRRDGKDGRR